VGKGHRGGNNPLARFSRANTLMRKEKEFRMTKLLTGGNKEKSQWVHQPRQDLPSTQSILNIKSTRDEREAACLKSLPGKNAKKAENLMRPLTSSSGL